MFELALLEGVKCNCVAGYDKLRSQLSRWNIGQNHINCATVLRCQNLLLIKLQSHCQLYSNGKSTKVSERRM